MAGHARERERGREGERDRKRERETHTHTDVPQIRRRLAQISVQQEGPTIDASSRVPVGWARDRVTRRVLPDDLQALALHEVPLDSRGLGLRGLAGVRRGVWGG